MGLLRHRRKTGGKAMSLQLTSLLDMFTIILVFLMVSFQSADEDFVLHSGLALPGSTAKSPFKTGVNLAITLEDILVEGARVVSLEAGGKVSDEYHERGKIDPLVAAVENALKNLKREAGEENVVVIQADEKLPYKTIHLAMRSAAHAGAYRFRLVVEKE
jgi:biopolymer transport protein ExbD